MNRSKIEWCDFSWNPITGCRHECAYCYARKQARRFSGDVRLNKASPQIQEDNGLYILDKPFHNANGKVIPMPMGFEPTLHKYRLSAPFEKKLPANIFVGSMADTFGHWVPDEWVKLVFAACEAAPWHNYLFLTKNIHAYEDYDVPTKDNYWYGQSWDGNRTGLTLYNDLGINQFLSIEPILSDTIPLDCIASFGWVIVGAETGSRRDKVIPKREWIERIVSTCRTHKVPVFLKNNLANIWGDPLIQEYPARLAFPSWEQRPVHKVFVESVRDDKRCRQCGKDVKGNPAWRISARYYICERCYKGERT